MKATHIFLEDNDLGRGAPGLGDDLGWDGEATRDAQGCGGRFPLLGLHSLRGTLHQFTGRMTYTEFVTFNL